MQNRTGWVQSGGIPNPNSPSSRLRASRPMPAWMNSTRNGPPPPPPPPKESPPEPDYEVIDFGNTGQIYSNTPIPTGKSKRCDLCGSSAPAVRCVQCTQNFCLSCDHMYHRHPKRQAHIRKELSDGKIKPPLPPKGESAPAPVPPPRRNKSGRPPPARPAAPPLQRDQEVKSPALLNSLRRALPNRPSASPTFPTLQNGTPPPQMQPSRPSPLEFHHHGNGGMSEWDVNRRSRAGSFSNLNSPGFSPLIQAQSMAHLNSPCPSCAFHGPNPAMSPWGNPDPWGTWGGMPPWQSQNILNQPTGRRGSRRGSGRRRRETSSGSDEEDDRMSRRGSRRSKVSPTPSRRSRAPPSDFESEDDDDGAEWDMRRGGGGSLPRRASQLDVNRPSFNRRDDDTMSLSGRRMSQHATMSRVQKERRYDEDDHPRNRRNTIEKIPFADDERSHVRSLQRTSDSEDSPRPMENLNSSLRRKSSRRSDKHSDSGRMRSSPAKSFYDNQPSDSPLDDDFVPQKIEEPNTVEMGTNLEQEESEPEVNWDPIPDFEWECEHCTFVNSPGTRVCAICCKTNTKPKMHVEKPAVTKLTQQMKATALDRTPSERRPQAKEMHERVERRPSQKSAQRQEPPYHERQQSRQEPTKRQSADREDRIQNREIPVQSHARGTSPMNSRRAQEINRIQDARSPDVRTPDTKTSDSSSYSSKNVTSKGTSPPPQSISTQTYEAPVTKLKRASSLADYSEWRAPQRTYSRQSLLSDTQSLPVTPPKGRSPERFPDLQVEQRKDPEPQHTRRRAGSQPPEYISTLVQKQVKQGLEMVKLLREAEEHKFSADDLAVALLHCEDSDPVAWLQQNWKNMIDTVVTLATNYGHERKENTVGTISASEARDALRIHDGNVWAAVTECVEQRQKKYGELLSRGNFSREDIVTVLTAHHGNLEAAYKELSKSQLKPFLMKIWGPPQGVDNESGDFTK
ncbi:IBR [Nesidiocoris tenuis]|uniref:IBR n=1 Tax=Nesidiocoris tenuis TaxID=355587 RepID=A0ABN7ADH5_9HEMI|nr:IBR [Nesidiocoris tenuis]